MQRGGQQREAGRACRVGGLAMLLALVVSPGCRVHDAQLLEDAEGAGGKRAPGLDAGAGDAGPDAGGVGADGCRPNPDATDLGCPEICPERCNGKDDDCDGTLDEAADADCATAHTVALCAQGACAIAECEGEHRDCDGRADNGCEVSIAEDPAHCGACRQACMLERAEQMSCDADYRCGVLSCSDGFGDCDLDPDNGCETLARTLQDCGGCASRGESQACEGLPNVASSDCATGSCRVTACEPGFIDCDGDADNGCEEPEGPSACGCDADPVDSDSDGEPDCTDRCDEDPDKTQEGDCGCGNPDTDRDGDGTPDCIDLCDDDPDKQEPGQCGCGNPDSDRDADGVAECEDGCPGDDRTAQACFPFAPSNLDPRALDFAAGVGGTLDCGTTRIDTSDPDGGGPLIASFDNWCGQAPAAVVVAQPGGPELVVIALRSLTLSAGATLELVGDRPLALAVRGDVAIHGQVEVDSGANWSCAQAGAGADGSGSPGRWPDDANAGASGGGGGGFGSAGGRGGTADTDNNGSGNGQGTAGGAGGDTRGDPSQSPLVGGCPGGRAGGCASAGGSGGGALQISASGTLAVDGVLRAGGAGGTTPCGSNDEGGGSGGGSGGALSLEAHAVDLGGATLDLAGGRGGRNGAFAGIYNCGNTQGGAGSSRPADAGGNGASCQAGGPGGGGGHGRLRVQAETTCIGCP